MKKHKKIISIILATTLFINTQFVVFATEAPTPPPAPENETVAPEAPTPPVNDRERPKPPSEPTDPPPRYTDSANNIKDESDGSKENSSSPDTNSSQNGVSDNNDLEGIDSNMNNGDTTISTADANSSTDLTTTGNTNTSKTQPTSAGTGSTDVSNSQDGAFSDNNSSATLVNTNDTNQENTAGVENQVDQSSQTGDNSASFNNGDSYIKTGESNTSANLVNAVNTNVDSVAIAEFNVADDHVGDIVLDYNSNCIQGCGIGEIAVKNNQNGAGSDNNAEANTQSNKNTDQLNDAALVNNVDLSANSGDNKTDFNTGGDSTIQTGDANVSANINNFVNNNLAGNVVLGVVNIYGDLVGDIVLTEEAMNAFCGNCLGSSSVQNTGNGAYSTNKASLSETNNNSTSQFNNADIENNLIIYANTGDNEANMNTGGNSTILTGDANVEANVVNVANTNLSDGNWWLVIVNEAGQWVGKLFGSNSEGGMASSEGLEFTTDGNGEVVVSNDTNGAGSENTSEANRQNNTSVNQANDAKIVNNVNLSANTGTNSASYNTGGDSTVQTGDANVVASIVNFVNNNIAGSGKLFVNVVNVFGSWLGDFMTPGYSKDKGHASNNLASDTKNQENTAGVGGLNQESENSSTSNVQSTSDEETVPSSSEKNQPTPTFSNYSGSLLASTSIAGVTDTYNAHLDKSDSADDKLAYSGENSLYDFTEDDVAGEKIVNINLAWVLIALVSFWTIRKTNILHKLLPAKKGAK